MNLVRQNPYNTIGVFAGVNQRTLAKQKSKINALQRVGKKVVFKEDFEFIGKPDRSKEDINNAFSNIEINKNRVFYSLFWFTQIDHIDKTAFSNLQANNIEKAKDIWQKVIEDKPVNKNNFSAYNNLGTLKLYSAFSNSTIDFDELKTGILLKTELIKSEEFKDFCELVADETYKVNQDKELESFIVAIIEQTNNKGLNDTNKPPVFISQINEKLKDIIAKNYTSKPINNIENKVKQAKNSCHQNPEKGFELGLSLFNNTKDDLSILSKILGKTDMRYKMIADKLADEVLLCAVDYFNCYNKKEEEHEGELGEDILQLLKAAKSVAVSSQIREKVSENIEALQKWIEDKPLRKKQKLIEEDLKFVNNKLDRFEKLTNSIDNADDLLISCKSKLQNTRNTLGAYDELYLNISSTVVKYALQMLIQVVNEEQKIYQNNRDVLGLMDVKSLFEKSLRVSKKIGAFDMTPEMRKYYNNNHDTLKSIASRVGVSVYSSTTPYSTSTTPKKPVSSNSNTTNTTNTTRTANTSNTPRPSTSGNEGIPAWLKWVGGIILFIILIRACGG